MVKQLVCSILLFGLVACGGSGSTNGGAIAQVAQDGTTSIDLNNLITRLNEYPLGTLSSAENADLVTLREEEKLAHDVYLSLNSQYAQPIFNNIANSEQTHTEAVLTLLDRYSIADPAANNGAGVFNNNEFQQLYTDLVNHGNSSLLSALIVGATVEDLDIRDIETMKSHTNKDDLMLVYNALQKGSRNHLRSFVKQINAAGGSYSPQYISEADYAAIINSDMERGF